MTSARAWVRAALLTSCACGPNTGHSDGSGSGGAIDVGQGESGSAAESEGSGCSGSDLPAPFCHELVELGIANNQEPGFGTIIGIVDDVRGGIKPLIVRSPDGTLLRLVDPVAPEVVAAEAPLPVGNLSGALGTLSTNFIGSAPSIAVFNDREVAILDGQTLELIAFRDVGDAWMGKCSAMDFDGDGDAELVTADYSPGLTISIWDVTANGLTLMDAEGVEPACQFNDLVRGDFDGDGRTDVVLAWHDDCRVLLGLAEPPDMLTILGPAEPATSVAFTRSPQPLWATRAVAGEFTDDGKTDVILAKSLDEITLLEWVGDGFVETTAITFAGFEFDTSNLGRIRAGDFNGDGRDDVLVGTFVSLDDAGGHEASFEAALFDAGDPASAVALPSTVGLIGDVNADGVADLQAAEQVDEGVMHSVYLSQ